jgi:hypothetical protein
VESVYHALRGDHRIGHLELMKNPRKLKHHVFLPLLMKKPPYQQMAYLRLLRKIIRISLNVLES